MSEKPTCTGPECDRPVAGRQDVCASHYMQRRTEPGRPLRPLRRHPASSPPAFDEMGHKQCATCGDWKSESTAYLPRPNGRGYMPNCRACHLVRRRELSGTTPPRDVTIRDASGHKLCARCREWLPEERFYRAGSKRRSDGYQPHCKDCSAEARLIKKYGIDLHQYDALLAQQENACATCGIPAPELDRRLQVDHDHAHCGADSACADCVRGLLCWNCNAVLGKYESGWNVTILEFEAYLASPPARQLLQETAA